MTQPATAYPHTASRSDRVTPTILRTIVLIFAGWPSLARYLGPRATAPVRLPQPRPDAANARRGVGAGTSSRCDRRRLGAAPSLRPGVPTQSRRHFPRVASVRQDVGATSGQPGVVPSHLGDPRVGAFPRVARNW